MKNKKGFLLISLCIYLLCFGLLLLGTIRLFLPALLGMHTCHKKTHTILDMQNVADVLLHDLWQATSDKKQWYIYNNTTLLWQSDNDAISWVNTPEGIMRMQGEYDSRRHVWHKKIQNLIAPSMQIQCTVQDSIERLLFILVTIKHEQEKLDVVWSFYGR
ncbi:MAG TPA: hypothetical protein VGW78_01920 [Candidatus Babeliales bacterium]|jgi:hypothetical protein|nr:hypothetical protein [Candidatus Babeliales bacterium]